MWTIVWIDKDDDVDRYERCEFAEDVKWVIENNNLGGDINVLIFEPGTEMEVNDFMDKYADK